MVAIQNSQKYDRQLRIWGEHGQRALEQARVCLLTAGPTGTEALKNLVLGGIGSFTVVDGATVEAHDLGNNYFLDRTHLGTSRAQAVTALLQELNESVAARFVEESPATLIQDNATFFSEFTLVIATQLPESVLLQLDSVCRQHGCQLIVARSYGLMGLIRISSTEHCVVEAKPDNTVDDLRLHKPWKELKEFAMGFDLDMEDAMLHKHIPYAVILLQAAQQWQQGGGRGEEGEAGAGGAAAAGEEAAPVAMQADGEGQGGASEPRVLPRGAAERSEFKGLIAAHQRHMDEDNFKEALAAAYKVWSPPPIGSELQAIFTDAAMQLSHASSDFWVLAAALKLFVEKEGEGDLPVDGAIPDMHSLTDFYVALQRIYLSKADADVAAVQRHVSELLKSIGKDPASIPLATIKLFCKNARNLRVVRFKPLSEEFGAGARACIPTLQRLMSSPDGSHAALYVLLRGADHFYSQFHRYPGSFPGDVDDDDVARLKSLAGTIVSGGGSPSQSPSIPDDLTAEMCRFGASELHCVAAVIGGVASQEAIKVNPHALHAPPSLPVGNTRGSGPLLALALAASQFLGDAASQEAEALVKAWSEAYGLGADSLLPPSAVSLPAGVPAAPHLEDCARASAEREAWERRGARGEEPAWTREGPRRSEAAASGGCSGQEQGEEVPQPPWIRGPDEANLPLTRVVQRDIWRHQFPPGDCTDKRLLIAKWPKPGGHGAGSQVHVMSAMLSLAMLNNRVLVEDPDTYLRARTPDCEAVGHNSRWDCYFFPITSVECRRVVVQQLVTNTLPDCAGMGFEAAAASPDRFVCIGMANSMESSAARWVRKGGMGKGEH
ncbi:unnamed protein product [Closterium sp. NIES-64]|nr:unnamed protein product [Closterium sp. NIES-64]